MGRRQVCRSAGAAQLASRAERSRDCCCGSRQKISILSVSHVVGRGHFERQFHKELIPNCMEPCVVSWSLFIESGRRLRSGQNWRCHSEGQQCAMETFSWPTIVRPTRRGAWIGRNEFLYLTSQLLQDRHTWTFRHGIQERDVCTLLLTNSMLGLPCWIRAGHQGVGDVRPACLFPLVKSKCFLDSGVRRCCKVGHSCMRRVIDCSSVQITRWLGAVIARGIRAVPRLGGPGCEFFDISQLRYDLDIMFQDLNTPPSRCCWRCGYAMSRRWPHQLQRLIKRLKLALPQRCCQRGDTSPSFFEFIRSRFAMGSVVSYCKPGRSQSFCRGWFSFSTPVMARAIFSFTSVSLVMLRSMVWQIRGIPIGGGHELGCRCGCVRCGGACLVGSATEA